MSERTSLWGLRLLALVLAILAWFLATAERREERSVERTIDASVTYTTPQGMTLLKAVEVVRVGVRGSTSQIQNLNTFQIQVLVDLRGAEKGAVEVNLGRRNVDLPPGVEMINVEPSKFVVDLDRVISEIRPVEANLVGEPAAGAVVLRTEVIPPQALISGPESVIGGLRALSTSPVSLNGHALDFEERAAVVSPDPKIQIVQPVLVTIRVALEVPTVGTSR